MQNSMLVMTIHQSILVRISEIMKIRKTNIGMAYFKKSPNLQHRWTNKLSCKPRVKDSEK